MPIMSVVDRSDARASARVLAQTAKRCIGGELEGSTHRVELVNMHRLLSAYKAHGFGGYGYETRSPRGPEALTLMPATDRHVVDLKFALDYAFKAGFGDEDVETAIGEIDVVIRCVVLEKDFDGGLREKTLRFLDSFIDRLVAN